MAKLDPYFAVFNQHINNAGERAMKALEEENPSFATEVRSFQESGIMGIFEQEPTPATKRYVELVTSFVNENEK